MAKKDLISCVKNLIMAQSESDTYYEWVAGTISRDAETSKKIRPRPDTKSSILRTFGQNQSKRHPV